MLTFTHRNPSFIYDPNAFRWSEPCKKLTPILEEVTLDNEGKFKLVNVNVDLCLEIAKELKVKSVPHVMLIHRGALIDHMVGFPSGKDL